MDAAVQMVWGAIEFGLVEARGIWEVLQAATEGFVRHWWWQEEHQSRPTLVTWRPDVGRSDEATTHNALCTGSVKSVVEYGSGPRYGPVQVGVVKPKKSGDAKTGAGDELRHGEVQNTGKTRLVLSYSQRRAQCWCRAARWSERGYAAASQV